MANGAGNPQVSADYSGGSLRFKDANGNVIATLDANGGFSVRGTAGGRLREGLTVSTISTAGAATYTAAQVAGGVIARDPNGAGRTDVMPDAADIIAAAAGNLAADGDAITCYLINTADAAEVITLGGTPTGVTYANAGQTLAQNESAILLIVRNSSTTVTVYIIGA